MELIKEILEKDMRHELLCEFYGVQGTEKVDLHHLYSQNTINTLARKGSIDYYFLAMFRDCWANLYPIAHTPHIEKSFRVNDVWPFWSDREFYLLHVYFQGHRNDLIQLNFGYDFKDNVFMPDKSVNVSIRSMNEKLLAVCENALHYIPKWVKQ